MQLSNFLFFTTTCEQALAFYDECGLGHVAQMVRIGDHNMPVANEAMRGKVLFAKFEGPGVLFYASDNDDAEPMRGSAHYIAISDRDKLKDLFERLSAGGKVTTPLGKQVWSSLYGKFTDKFGVQWMLNCTN